MGRRYLYNRVTMAAAATLTLKPQGWGEAVRLPTCVEPGEIRELLAELEFIQKPSLPFQSKHLTALKRNTWFALQRPADRSRTGLLCVWPRGGGCFYVSGSGSAAKHRVAVLRLRVEPEFLERDAGLTVFAATLSPVSRTLWIEDVLHWKGRSLWDEDVFSTRQLRAAQWLEHYCIQDARLLGGLTVELAPWGAIDAVRPEGAWELQGDGLHQRRLLWIAGAAAAPVKEEAPAPAPSSAPAGPLVAVATREPGPEQWMLSAADGVSLGRALVRTLAVSTELRTVTGAVSRVLVSWNTVFSKWEVTGIAAAGAVASHSSFFEASK